MIRTIKASLLFFVLSLCASALFLTHQLRSHAPAPAPRALFAVVEKQMAAFRAADYSGAYCQAASGVQQKFTVPQFEAMIRHDYRDIMNARRIEFGFVQVQGSVAAVQVFFVSDSGFARSFLYSLVAEGDFWKINGVEQMQSVPPGRRLASLQI